MEHKDWCNSRATCVCDHPAICERAWNAALKYNKVVAKIASNTQITPPDERDCDTCKHDGECLVTMIKCKGYSRAA